VLHASLTKVDAAIATNHDGTVSSFAFKSNLHLFTGCTGQKTVGTKTEFMIFARQWCPSLA
jgi:hypothetical protein